MVFRLISKCYMIVGNAFMEGSYTRTAIKLACAAVGGAAVLAAGPLALGALGFTSAGISAGSIGASMMSLASGLGFGCGIVRSLQSAGATGLGAGAFLNGASAGSGVASAGFWITDRVNEY
ncbi:interferon alpha-inducible protein 27, mitochondrial [Plakobranchus ocellatus]|uniref:Interferon alpha-inducible protein 27, mitochondrial n=1 Tax=Plakobranchus ocellatus TaxID=259542 RepID=A0AAV4BJA5_9GAST|nr:interferon alpha-inducible protein 27, mitochondrial [Plakobranchus ocellatus]